MHTGLTTNFVGPTPAIAFAIGALGVILWLTGAAWSRSLITLIFVTAGCLLGLHLPRIFGWHVDQMATGIGGALALGLAGYAGHRWWLGLSVGINFAVIFLGVAAVIWGSTHHWMYDANHLDAPREHVSVMAVTTLSAAMTPASMHADSGWGLLKQILQMPIVHFALGAAVIGFIVGLMIAVRWPRLTASLVWSNVGLSTALAMADLIISPRYPHWQKQMISTCVWLVFAPLALWMLGAAVQFYIAGRLITPVGAADEDDKD